MCVNNADVMPGPAKGIAGFFSRLVTFRKYPIALLGVVIGSLRYESCGGSSLFSRRNAVHFLVNEGSFIADDPKDGVSKPFAVTHLQKESRAGFLVMWPLCFHLWFTFRYQQKRIGDGGAVIAIPGSERVLYWRAGWARWDAGDCRYMVHKIGFGTWYGPGLHWD